jgi:hypothetical protein
VNNKNENFVTKE